MTEKVFEAFTRLDASDVNAYLVNRPLQNAIINGAFDFWQRGTSFTDTSGLPYTADRWTAQPNGSTVTYSRQAFTAGTILAPGFGDAEFFMRVASPGGGTARARITQRIENVRTLAGQTVTLSFWAKADGSKSLRARVFQEFGPGDQVNFPLDVDLTTSWQRFVLTADLPSVAGKTITSASFLAVQFLSEINQAITYDIWGVQLEAGSVPTPFRRNANSIQGELAACQRYYLRHNASSANAFERVGFGSASSTTGASILIPIPVQLRSNPSSIEFSGLSLFDGTAFTAVTGATLDNAGVKIVVVVATVASGLSQFRPYQLGANNNANMFLGINAEL